MSRERELLASALDVIIEYGGYPRLVELIKAELAKPERVPLSDEEIAERLDLDSIYDRLTSYRSGFADGFEKCTNFKRDPVNSMSKNA